MCGLSDDCNGTVGLDIAVRCAQMVPCKTARVLAFKRSDYLGSDPNHEPDATSGVYQCVIATSSPTLWVKQSFEVVDFSPRTGEILIEETHYNFEWRSPLIIFLLSLTIAIVALGFEKFQS